LRQTLTYFSLFKLYKHFNIRQTQDYCWSPAVIFNEEPQYSIPEKILQDLGLSCSKKMNMIFKNIKLILLTGKVLAPVIVVTFQHSDQPLCGHYLKIIIDSGGLLLPPSTGQNLFSSGNQLNIVDVAHINGE
jgi:hypothetical protein